METKRITVAEILSTIEKHNLKPTDEIEIAVHTQYARYPVAYCTPVSGYRDEGIVMSTIDAGDGKDKKLSRLNITLPEGMTVMRRKI